MQLSTGRGFYDQASNVGFHNQALTQGFFNQASLKSIGIDSFQGISHTLWEQKSMSRKLRQDIQHAKVESCIVNYALYGSLQTMGLSLAVGRIGRLIFQEIISRGEETMKDLFKRLFQNKAGHSEGYAPDVRTADYTVLTFEEAITRDGIVKVQQAMAEELRRLIEEVSWTPCQTHSFVCIGIAGLQYPSTSE